MNSYPRSLRRYMFSNKNSREAQLVWMDRAPFFFRLKEFMESFSVELGFGIDYVVADGMPLSVTVAEQPKGADKNTAQDLKMTFTETWRECDGTKSIRRFSNVITVERSEGQRLANLILHVETLARELNRILSVHQGVNHEQATSMAMCCTPSAVDALLEDLQYGRATSIVGSDYPMIGRSFVQNTSVAGSFLDKVVPLYNDDFLDLFKGTSIHTSMVVNNFLTEEVNKLRMFCCRSMDEPVRVLEYCRELRSKVQAFRSGIVESAHISSVLANLEKHEIERAENWFQHRLDQHQEGQESAMQYEV